MEYINLVKLSSSEKKELLRCFSQEFQEKPIWEMDAQELENESKNTKLNSPFSKFIDENIAKVQRGHPEEVMVAVQLIYGGGVLHPVVENVGDLIHRMSEKTTYDSAGFSYVKKKVKEALYDLTSPYGFEREMRENIIMNAKYKNIDPDILFEKVSEKLKEYADAHRSIPTFNYVQRKAKAAAVAVGQQRWNDAIENLEYLKSILDQGIDAWISEAHKIDYDDISNWSRNCEN